MKGLCVVPLVAALLAVSVAIAGDVGPQLQAVSVNIKAGSSQGSGTVILRKVDGVETAFVITAAHVIDGMRSVKTVIKEGDEKKVVTYTDAQVVQEVPTQDQSRIVGDRRLDARVLTVDKSRDIALLRVRATGEFKTGVKFFQGETVPTAGTEIIHCGAPGGQDTGGTATVTAGIVSRTGVRIKEYGGSDHGIYDQTDTAAMGGSSGGMICLRESGEWIGMITLGLRSGDNFHWFVPIRNVRDWSKEAKCEWLLKEGGTATSKEVDEIPLENGGGGGGDSAIPVPAIVPAPGHGENELRRMIHD